MILGASHATLLSKDIKIDGKELQKLGYSMSFMEDRVPNDKGKHSFLSYPSSYHSLALYRHKDGISIELIIYDNFTNQLLPRFNALFDGNVPEGLQGNICESRLRHDLDDMFDHPLQPFSWQTFGTKIWFNRKTICGNGLMALILSVRDLGHSQKFWEKGLGCKLVKRGVAVTGRRWILESFKSPVKSWKLDIILVEDKDVDRRGVLDAVGFNCLSALTTNLKQDRLKLFDTGAEESTGEFELEINNKVLVLEVFRGPDGEFIELLQVKSVGRKV